MNKKFLFKKLIKWKRFLFPYREKQNCRELSGFVGFIRQVSKRVQRKRCNKKCIGWSRKSVGIYFETISFIRLNPLVPGVPDSASGKTLFRVYERRKPGLKETNGLKETLFWVIISDGRWKSSGFSSFSVFQDHLILLFTMFSEISTKNNISHK